MMRFLFKVNSAAGIQNVFNTTFSAEDNKVAKVDYGWEKVIISFMVDTK